ncbi:hypothetical protein VTL71DRAFT_4718 [Oculimacula yallundae]|uniref:DUF676 domain-containing protein n=1 Tax=Oculimacula yallundae TaxID=86028 RepID=A0ABR4C2V4_9HELO
MKKLYQTLSSKLKFSSQRTSHTSIPDSYQSPNPAPEEAKLHLIYTDSIPTLDIIVIHGLPSSHHSPWSTAFTSRTTGCSWLRDLLPPFFHAQSPTVPVRVFVFGYVLDESIGLEDVVSSLGKEVLRWGVGGMERVGWDGYPDASMGKTENMEARKVLWIAHSLGGGLLKGFLSAESEARDNTGKTMGVLFFGVPRGAGGGHGGGFAGLSTALASQGSERESGSVVNEEQDVSPHVKKLREEAKYFAKGAEDFEVLCDRGQVGRVVYFLESAGENVVVGTGRDRELEVGIDTEDDSGLDEGGIRGEQWWEGNVRIVQTTKGHGAMIRFEGREDGEWKHVEKILSRL